MSEDWHASFQEFAIPTKRMENNDKHQKSASHRHFKMYKPAKVLTQFVFNHKKRKRRQLLGDVASVDLPPEIMAIGRLDEDSEGLLLLTTNGKFSELVRRKSVEKEYWAQVGGQMTIEALKQLQEGVNIRLAGQHEMYRTLPCKARILETTKQVEINAKKETTTPSTPQASTSTRTTDSGPESCRNITSGRSKGKRRKFKGTCNNCGLEGHKTLGCPTNGERPVASLTKITALPAGILPASQAIRDEACHGPTSWISVTVTEGKNRQVRKMTAAVGFPTLRLIRVRIGQITLDDNMKVGEVREMAASDVSKFCTGV
jgi:23S rRNA pseudouridine2457 synthase